MGFELQLIMFVASTTYQVSQQRKMKRKQEAEAEKRKGFKFTVSGEIGHLPVVYGKQALGGFQTLHKTLDSFDAASQVGNVFKSNNQWNSNRDGQKNEFLLVQAALCQDGINRCRYVKVNDKPFDHKEIPDDEDDNDDGAKVAYDNIISVNANGGAANPLATANEVSAKNYFTGAANATMIYKLNRDEPQYQGVPNNTFFVEGRKVRRVSSNGTLLSTYVYSNNPAWCLLDYLLGDFGRNLDPIDVDLISFYRAAQVCQQVVANNLEIGGRVNGIRPIKELGSFSVFPSEGDEDFIYKAENTGIYYNWDAGNGTFTTTTVPTRDIPLYECNIALDSEATVRDNIEAIMSTMGQAELIWSSKGQYKLILDYPSSLTQVRNLAVQSFDEDSIVRETVTLSYPSAADRYNRVTVRFSNEHEDFKDDSMSWPPLNEAVHQQYLAEDNNQPMTTDIYVDGITDPYHALAKAEQIVRQARSSHFLTLTVDKTGLTVEPGDIIRVTLSDSNIDDDFYRVESMKVLSDLTVELNCYFFDHTTLSWNIADDIAYGNPPRYDFVVPAPRNVTVTSLIFTAPDGTTYTSLKVSWSISNSVSIAQYEIQYKTAEETEYNSIFTRNTTYIIQNVEPNVEYNVRVRAMTSLGVVSGFNGSNGTHVGKDIDPNPPTNFSATGAFGYIALVWSNPADRDLKEIQIYEADSNSFASANFIATVTGNTYNRPNLAPLEEKYYWIRAVDRSGRTSVFVGPQSAFSLQIGVGDIGPAIIKFANFDETVDTVFTSIDNSIAAITDDFDNFVDEYDGNISQLTLADLSSLATDIDNTYTNTSTLEQNYYTAANADSAISAAITTLKSTIEDPSGTSVGADLNNNYYTSAATDSAISFASTNLKSIIEDPNGTSLGADLSNNYYTAADADGAISAAITELSATVGDNYATIQSVTSVSADLTGVITANYGVTIDNNGSITGYQLLSGAAGSAFNVRADQFAVFNATGAGGDNPFTIFTSSRTIDGVVYPAGTYIKDAIIDNAAIINGSITTAKIKNLAVDNAKIKNAAITNAKIGNAAITTAKIGDLQVDTLKIANQAVSNTGSDSGSLTTSSSAYSDLCDLTLNTEGGNALIIQIGAAIAGTPAGGEATVGTAETRILVGSTIVSGVGGVALSTSLSGTTRVRFQIRKSGGDSSIVASANMVVTELKK